MVFEKLTTWPKSIPHHQKAYLDIVMWYALTSHMPHIKYYIMWYACSHSIIPFSHCRLHYFFTGLLGSILCGLSLWYNSSQNNMIVYFRDAQVGWGDREGYRSIHMPFCSHSNQGSLQSRSGITLTTATMVEKTRRWVPRYQAWRRNWLESTVIFLTSQVYWLDIV